MGGNYVFKYETKTTSRWWQITVLMKESWNHSIRSKELIHSGIKQVIL
jgi:hypothetical protein